MGTLLLKLIEAWHTEVSLAKGGQIDLAKSYYLLMQWDTSGNYQLYQYSLKLPPPEALTWQVVGRRLVGLDSSGAVIEWYGLSGGQLKYYPFTHDAVWISELFQLEPLPPSELGYGLSRKARDYFPELWEKVTQ